MFCIKTKMAKQDIYFKKDKYLKYQNSKLECLEGAEILIYEFLKWHKNCGARYVSKNVCKKNDLNSEFFETFTVHLQK